MSGPGEEAERRRRMHDLERQTARKPEDPGPGRPDPIHVIRARRHDQPGIAHFGMARWSLITRLVRDAEGSGDEVADLGPDALMLCQAAQRGQWVRARSRGSGSPTSAPAGGCGGTRPPPSSRYPDHPASRHSATDRAGATMTSWPRPRSDRSIQR